MKELFLVLILSISVAIAFGQTTRYVKPTASGTGDGSTWANASGNLQNIIDVSAVNDVIWIAAGTYIPSEAPDGTVSTGATDRNNAFHIDKDLIIYGGFAGTESQLSERSLSTNTTILSGDFSGNDMVTGVASTLSITNNTENAYHVLITANLTNAALIDGITISGGFTDVTDFSTITYSSRTIYKNEGAGMMIAYSDLRVNGLTFYANSASSASENASGGGMYISTCAPTITNCIFDRNVANFGGGIHIYSGSFHAPVLTNITVSGNLAKYGGGINNSLGGNTILTNCIIYGNHATSDGSNLNIDNGTPTTSYSNIEGSGGSSSWNSGFGTDGGNNIDADPLFTNTSTGDVTLQGNSPVINVGTATNTPTVDIIGTARPTGAGHDMGAYEYTATLPVELLDFQAVLVDDYKVRLNWQTASELNNSHFDVEWSKDAIEFTKIGQIEGAGTTNDVTFYDFLHTSPALGLNYYRLKQHDFDGKFEYTNIINITIEQSNNTTINIYPNPASHYLKIESEDLIGEVVQVFSVNGQLVKEFQHQSLLTNLPITNLPDGTYFIKVGEEVKKVIVQK